MINAEDRRLRKDFVQNPIQRLRGRQIAAEWLLDNNSRAASTSGFRKAADDDREHAWRDGKIMKRTLRTAECFSQALVRRRVVIVAINVLKTGRQFYKCTVVG